MGKPKNNKLDVLESYKSIIINIEDNIKENNVKTIAVVSYKEREGRTTICKGLATSLSTSGKKVLIVDCNLRKPAVNSFFNIKAQEGLLDVLLEGKALDEVIYKYNDYLNILSVGSITNNETDIINSGEIDDILRILRDNYDYIIIDTPELEHYTDAQVAAKKADGVLLILKEQKNVIRNIQKAKRKLEVVNANILGIVINESKINS